MTFERHYIIILKQKMLICSFIVAVDPNVSKITKLLFLFHFLLVKRTKLLTVNTQHHIVQL